MNSYKIKVKKIGKGTEDDPIRPDLDSIEQIKQFNEVISKYQITNVTFYTVRVTKELNGELEVEIDFPNSIPKDLPEEVKIAWRKLVESFGT